LSAWKISQYSLWFAFPCPSQFFLHFLHVFFFPFLLFFIFQRHFTAAFHGWEECGATLRHCLLQKLNNFIKYSNGAGNSKKRNKLQSAQKKENTDFVSEKKVSSKKQPASKKVISKWQRLTDISE